MRLAVSKNCLVILSDRTRKTGSMLTYEIEKAVDLYAIPLIIAYTGYECVREPRDLADRWPNALTERVSNRSVRAIHIPFKKGTILDAINQFTVQNDSLDGPLHHYTKEAHVNLGCVCG